MLLNPINAVAGAIIILLAGSILSLAFAFNRRLMGWFTFLTVAIAGVIGLYASILTITHGQAQSLTLVVAGTPMRLYMDGLAAIFVGLISVVGILAAAYSITYMDHYPDYHPARYYPWFHLFIAGMFGIVTLTDTMQFFFVFWQLLTIPSFFLIRFESRKRENVRAANKYLFMMEIACLAVMAGSAVLVFGSHATEQANNLSRFDFDALRGLISAGGFSSATLCAAFLLLLVGFGIKAGLWPFGQIWLPDAHPAAPSPVSALLSGVMIKTGIYGIIRVFFWLTPDISVANFSPKVWGAVLALLGTVTLLAGTFQALKQEQTKRLLAFHSIGQVGYIVLGLGASLMLATEGVGVGTLATIALVGALFHTINHALFKSLLFFNAGTILKATHTQDLNKLGGLFNVMPLTAVTCLIASFSIAGVPLFNGFASKWSIYAATITGHVPLLAVCGLLGILTSALTLASFMKFFGISFLSRESTIVKQQKASGKRLEATFGMQAPQVFLGIACLALGIVPSMGYLIIGSALACRPEGLASALPSISGEMGSPMLGLSPGGGSAIFIPLIIGGVIAALMAGAYVFSRLGSAPRRKADIWLCGYDTEADIHRYGAHNLYGEVKHLFGKKH
jgi:hydrogenase-4 component B